MSEVRPTHNNEIDLLEFIETLWDEKWKIVVTTIIAAVIGVVFVVTRPNSFEVSTQIQTGKQLVFLRYTPLNELLKTNYFSLSVDEESVFKMFVNEFNDYEEMVDALSSSEHVQNLIKDLDKIDKERVLIGLAKSFEIKSKGKISGEENWVLYFKWHNDLEGARIFNDAIQKTLKNIRDTVKTSVDDLATVIDSRNTQELEILRNKLKIIKQKQSTVNKKRIQYLLEQSAIAKELGIESNKLDANGLSQSSQSGISLSVNSNDVPFYLRGYKAIDKEILLTQSRTEDQKLLNAEFYIETKEKILTLEKDISSAQIRKASNLITSDNPNDWVLFNFAIADVKSQKKSRLYIALSIALGGIIGTMYVLISSIIRKRKGQLAKA